MVNMRIGALMWIATTALCGLSTAPAAGATSPCSTIGVDVAPSLVGSHDGRLLVFVEADGPGGAAPKVDTSAFAPTRAFVAAREMAGWKSGEKARVDLQSGAYPAAFSTLPAGRYRFQAVLDRNHNYNYRGRGEGDLVSPIVTADLPGPCPDITLGTEVQAKTPEQLLAQLPPDLRERLRTGLAAVQRVDFVSPALTAFWGRPVSVRGYVALPPGYGRDGATYPTVFKTGGFGSTMTSAGGDAAFAHAGMAEGRLPPMIWVVLDESSATGTHEFADSANNGPWGTALTSEFLPWLEGRYRMDARPGSRFLTGHSSGGWAGLWLQTRYPAVFGGVWATSPDPGDFHDFAGVDIYAPGANLYRREGTPVPAVREQGKVVATNEQAARLEAVLGSYGGQFASFEWVFSPRGEDGRPMPLFDRTTGAVDPTVAAYWRANYDMSDRLARDWTTLRNDLDGKIHVVVGTADTFYLDGPARRLQAALDRAGARSSFTYLPGRGHFDLYARGSDSDALTADIAWAMYAVARPGAARTPVKR